MSRVELSVVATNAGGEGVATFAVTVLPTAPNLRYPVAPEYSGSGEAALDWLARVATAESKADADSAGGSGSGGGGISTNSSRWAVEVGCSIKAAPVENGGGRADTFDVSPELPDGLELDRSSGVLSGAVTLAQRSWIQFTITARNTSGSSSHTVELRVLPALPSMKYPSAVLRLIAGERSESAAPVSVGAGGAVDVFKLAKESAALPEGLELDQTSGAIVGTPALSVVGSGALLETSLVVAAVNEMGACRVPVQLVIAPPAPRVSYGGAAVLTVGVAASVAPVVSRGPVQSWRVRQLGSGADSDSALPAGLSLDASTGVVSGVPKEASCRWLAGWLACSVARSYRSVLLLPPPPPPPLPLRGC